MPRGRRQTVAVTASYIHARAGAEFFAKMDAANIDLKGFTEAFLLPADRRPSRAGARRSLQYVARHTDCWLEATLLIPGLNDSTAELDAMTHWIAERLGPDVPLHFTAFHPDYKMTGALPTPPSTLRRAHQSQLTSLPTSTGNVHDAAGGTTHCRSARRL